MLTIQTKSLVVFLWLANFILATGQSPSLDDDVEEDEEKLFMDGDSATFFDEENTSAPVSPPPPPLNFNVFVGHTNSEEETQAAPNGLQILVAIFFFVATAWLLIAIFYALMALVVLRLRSRGRLDLFDEEFGRLYIFGNRWYIPFGCILRRYAVTFGHDQVRGEAHSRSSDYKKIRRSERRQAIEQILFGNAVNTDINGDNGSKKQCLDEKVAEHMTSDGAAATTRIKGDGDSVEYPDPEPSTTSNSEGPVCSICLAGYGKINLCRVSICATLRLCEL